MTSFRRPADRLTKPTSANPAASAAATNSSAPAGESLWPCWPGLSRYSASSRRPPGAMTRRHSVSPRVRSTQWCTELRAHTTEVVPSPNGRCSASPSTKTAPCAPRSRQIVRASRSAAGLGSTPVADAPCRTAAPYRGAGPAADFHDTVAGNELGGLAGQPRGAAAADRHGHRDGGLAHGGRCASVRGPHVGHHCQGSWVRQSGATGSSCFHCPPLPLLHSRSGRRPDPPTGGGWSLRAVP